MPRSKQCNNLSRRRKPRLPKLLMLRLSLALLAFLGVGTLLAMKALAAPGDLDPTFGSGGKITTNVSSSSLGATEVVIQNDGKIVTVGGGSGGFALVRYKANGSLDTSFGSQGKVITTFGGCWALGCGLALQNNGKIVVAGTSNGNFALARFNANGTFDTTFDSDGRVTTDFGSAFDQAYAVAVQPDGRIVAVGSFNNWGYGAAPGAEFAVARYLPNGSLDTSFDSDGKVRTLFDPTYWGDAAYDVAIRADGTIIVAGVAEGGVACSPLGSCTQVTGPNFAVAAFTPTGRLDTTFGAANLTNPTARTGKIVIDLEARSADYAYSLDLDSRGNIILGGYSYRSSTYGLGPMIPDFYGPAIVRLTPKGLPDPTFGVGGTVTSHNQGYGAAWHPVFDLVVDPADQIIVAGQSDMFGSPGRNFAVARYSSLGLVDSNFGTSGITTTDFGLTEDVYGVALQSDGKVVVAGASGSYFALARYLGDE